MMTASTPGPPGSGASASWRGRPRDPGGESAQAQHQASSHPAKFSDQSEESIGGRGQSEASSLTNEKGGM